MIEEVTVVTPEPLRFLILNCYPRESRRRFDELDVGHPHQLFRRCLLKYAPNAKVEVRFVADVDEPLPSANELGRYDGIVWTGSDLTIYHTHDPRVARQIELARLIYRVGIPSYGSCWGIQMAAVAAGGEVRRNAKGREWGVARDIARTAEGKDSFLLRGKPDRYSGFIMHLDEVTRLPQGARLLATGEHTRVQAMEVVHRNGVFWATQYHPEYDFYEMGRLIRARAEALVREGFFGSTEEVLRHVELYFSLHRDPSSPRLRAQLGVGDEIIDPSVRERELRNWIEFLVLPLRKERRSYAVGG